MADVFEQLLKAGEESRKARLGILKRRLEDVFEFASYDEITKVCEEIQAEQFAKGEIADHQTLQQGATR